MNSRRLMLAPLMTEHRTGKNYRAGRGMSALGQKQTYAVQKVMSALLPKADICSALSHLLFANSEHAAQNTSSCDNVRSFQCLSFPTFRSPNAGPPHIPTGFSFIRSLVRQADLTPGPFGSMIAGIFPFGLSDKNSGVFWSPLLKSTRCVKAAASVRVRRNPAVPRGENQQAFAGC
jgi:hypothetical protein